MTDSSSKGVEREGSSRSVNTESKKSKREDEKKSSGGSGEKSGGDKASRERTEKEKKEKEGVRREKETKYKGRQVAVESARKIAKAVASVVDVDPRKVTKVTISRDLVEDIRGALVSAGVSRTEALSMSAAKVLVEAQALIKYGKIAGEGKSIEEKLARAIQANEGEELEEREVERLVRVESREKVAEMLDAGVAKSSHHDTREVAEIVVETKKSLPFLNRDEAQKELDSRGVSVKLPEEYNKWAFIKRREWFEEKGIYEFADWEGANPGGAYVDGEIPAIAGGSGEMDWEDVTKEKHRERAYDEEAGRVVDVIGDRNIGAEVAVKRLVELTEASALPHGADALKKIEDDLEKLNAYFKLNILDPAEAGIANNRDFDKVSELARVSDQLSKKYELAGKDDVLNKVLPLDLRERFKKGKALLDKHFREEFERDPQKYRELFKRVDEEASSVVRIQEGGFYGRADSYRENFNRVAEEEIKAAVGNKEQEMLRWRVVTSREGFDQSYGEIQINQPAADWRDSEQNLDRVLRLLERADFDEQQLSIAINNATKIVLSIPTNSLEGEERREAERKQKELTEKVKSVLAVNQFYSTMELQSMNPEKMLPAIQHLEDHTFQVFFERFSQDAKGHDLPEIVKGKKKDGSERRGKLNLLDVGMNLYMKRFNRERKVMNFVEKWTKDPNAKFDDDVKEECQKAKEIIEDLTGGSRELGEIKRAVSSWYQQYTLLGANKEHKGHGRETSEDFLVQRKKEMVGDRKMFEEKTAEEKAEQDSRLWKDGLVEELVAHKDEWGLDEARIKEMVDAGLVDQVMNNAQRLAWMMAWSDYDGIRIHDPEGFEYGGKKQLGAYVYNQSTDFFYGRMIDHAWEFYVDEGRGKVPKTNLLMQDEMLGKRGNLLPQNRTLVRMASDLLGEDYVNNKFKEKKGAFKNLDKFNVDRDEEEKKWAKSAVVGEMIDDAELSFENSNWSEVFDERGSWKYRWIDLYGDRAAMMKYMDGTVLQKYLQQPNSKLFFQINSIENFYSKREVRLQPWMKLVIPAHQRMGNYWKEWWGMPDRMTHAEKEEIIDYAAQSNRLDAKYKNEMKKRHLGWGNVPGVMPVRWFRQVAEAADFSARVGGSTLYKSSWKYPFAVFGEFWKQGFKYVFS